MAINGAATTARLSVKAIAQAIVRYRWLVIAVNLLVVGAAASGLPYLTENPDSRVFFSRDNPHLLALEALENTYTRNDNVLFVVAPKDGNVFTPQTLAAIEWVTEELWRVPFSRRVDSITNFQHTEADGDDLVVGDLVKNGDALSPGALERVRGIALAEPLLVDRLVSPDGGVTAINVNVTLPAQSTTEVPEVVAFVRDLSARVQERYPDIEVHLTGGVMISMAFSEVPAGDFEILFPLMLVLLLTIIWLFVRSLAGTGLTLSVIVLSVAAALGVVGWMGVPLDPATMSAPMIILTLAVADSVHLLVSMRQAAQRGMSRHEAVVEAVRVNLAPVFITSVTTAIGCLSLNFSDAPPFRMLGNIVAIGVMTAWMLSTSFLPAMIAALPIKLKPIEERSSRLMERFARFVIARRKPLLVATSLGVIALTTGIARIDLDDNFIEYFDPAYDIRTASDFVEDRLTGLNQIEYSVPAADEGGINDPDYLSKLERFAGWYRAQPHVTNVAVLTDIIKRLNQNMHGDDPAFYRIPDERDLAAQYLLLYELSLPFGLDLNDQISVGKSSTRMTVAVVDITSKQMRQLDARAQDWLKNNIPEFQTPGTGISMIFAHISDRNIRSMVWGTAQALVLISITLIVAMRSFLIGLISLIPNLVPAGMAFGLWGYIDGNVGLSIAVVASMTMGVVVDDTVHFLSKYLRGRREHNYDQAQACIYAFGTVGMALLVTSATLALGFLVLSFSGFQVNAEMGLLSAITISLAIIADFLFLPPLLMQLDRSRA